MFSPKLPHTLASLVEGLTFKVVCPPLVGKLDEQLISSVTSDSREVVSDSLFIALPGVVSDGHDFIKPAIAAGCSVIVCGAGRLTEKQAKQLQVIVIEVEDTAKAYAAVAANYFRKPAEKLHFIGITGTNGKTTVTYLLEQVFLEAGLAVGVIGTVDNRYTGRSGFRKILKTRFTTPEAFLLQELLREMVDNGVEYVIMEVSSHALVQSRIGSILFDVAAFTNLSRDHLDYHAGMEDYFRAKTLLFSEYMKAGGVAVIPAMQGDRDDRKWLHQLHDICKINCTRTIQWGESEGADVQLHDASSTLERTDLKVLTSSGRHTLFSPLVGRYNVDNILTVYSLCLAIGLSEELICGALSRATGAPGRVERVTTGSGWNSKGPVVLVDYAHTPDALEKVLTTVAALPHGELFCVFGCGGDRDSGKRALMGEIAGKFCDVAVVTDDNPRKEDPERIVGQILGGLNKTSLKVKDSAWLSNRKRRESGYVVIRDRREAIEAAIRAALPEDIVVIAGKGHEPYQLTLEGKRYFEDRQEAQSVLFSWTAELVTAAVSGILHGPKQPKLLGPVVTDSRVVCQNGIFVALKGENHDAHDYALQAIGNGATCLVVERLLALPADTGICQVEVADTLQALGDMASFRRRALAEVCEQVVIGITGSCGKTTVKEMVASILERMWPEGPNFQSGCVLKTKGNFNNLIGLPLSLLPLDVGQRAAVLEMGMNQPGELKRLGKIADPDISCITNIHGAHLEGLQSIEGVAQAKEELFAATKESGILIVNLDDRRIRELSSKYDNRKITFSVQAQEGEQKTNVWASAIQIQKKGVIDFTMHHEKGEVEVQLGIAGVHNVSNALCAAAICLAAGAELESVAAGLADFQPPDKRMEMLRGKSGFTVINDTYNANPASMAAGLKTLHSIAEKKSTAIIGDMLELGADSRQAHYDVGKLIAILAIDCVGVMGEFKQDVLNGALEHGFNKDCIHAFDEKVDVVQWFNKLVSHEKLGQDDVVLVKASRGLRFETIVAEIIDF